MKTMSWLEIVLLLALLQSISIVYGQLLFPDDDNSDNTLQSRRQFGQTSQQQSFSNQRQRQRQGNGRPRQRPRQTSVTDGTTTTAQPERVTRCRASCAITSQYNPVCGTDGQNYNNMSVLRCAQACGINVQYRRMGLCAPRG